MKPAIAILVSLLLVAPVYGQSNDPSPCADGSQPSSTGECADGSAPCPDGQVHHDGSCQDPQTACEADGGSWDGQSCQFPSSTCPDGSQQSADGTCPSASCSDGSQPDSAGNCPDPQCADGTQPDSTGQCPPHCPDSTQADGSCSECTNADGTACDPESECYEHGGAWNGEYCEFDQCPDDHHMNAAGECEWKGDQCAQDGGYYDSQTGDCMPPCPDGDCPACPDGKCNDCTSMDCDPCASGQCGDPCHEELRGFYNDWMALHDEFGPRFQAKESDFRAAEQAGRDAGWSREQWDAFYYDWEKAFFGLEEEFMQRQNAIIEKWRPEVGDCAPRMDEMRHAPCQDCDDHSEADKLRSECEDAMQGLKDEYFATDDPARRDQIEREIRQHEADCEARAREYYQDHYEGGDDFNDKFGTLTMEETAGGMIRVSGKHLNFIGDPNKQLIEKFDCLGLRTIAKVLPGGGIRDVQPFEGDTRNTALGFWDQNQHLFMTVHDDRKCTVKINNGGAAPILTLPSTLDCVRSDRGFRCVGSSHEVVVLLDGEWEQLRENEIKILGRASVFLVDQAVRDAAFGEGYIDALADNRIGAEATIAATEDGVVSQTVTLGDLEMSVSGDRKKVTALIESEEGVGKTVTMSFAADHFDARPELTIFETQADGSEIPLRVLEADSLEDILDPDGDDDEPNAVEYWIVEDKNGMHVMLSFYHFSLKRVEVSDVETQSSAGGAEAIPLPAWIVGVAFLAARRRW